MVSASLVQMNGFRLLVVMPQVLTDRALERRDTGERATADSPTGHLQQPSFDEIEPRAARRDEVKVDARMTAEPTAHGRAFMRAQIVQDQMQLLALRRRGLDTPEELHKFLTAVAPPTLADHDAVQDAERRIQRRRPVADVIVGLPFRAAAPECRRAQIGRPTGAPSSG
jgi:hypothetical protein